MAAVATALTVKAAQLVEQNINVSGNSPTPTCDNPGCGLPGMKRGMRFTTTATLATL
jgi:hypothetical protein